MLMLLPKEKDTLFKEVAGALITVFKRKEQPQTIQQLSRNYTQTIQKILEIISENPRTTIKSLANATGLSDVGVKYNLKKLKQDKLIRRVGPDKGGHWEVMV